MDDTQSGANAAGYRVLARKYRPRTFPDLIGQEAMVRTLTNAFASGRIAQGFMLTGVRGVGKTTTARLIARALNYGGRPAIDMPEMGPHCEPILESRHMDVIEMDAASNTGVDNMREIIDSVRYAPVHARYKVYIIDEVHMLSKNAFNALLKTLEEPPPHVKFIFATTEINKVPVTILSRCQRFDLKRLDAALLASHYGAIAVREGVEAEADALAMIARAAEGSVRDGLSLLDQAIAYGEGKVKAADVAAMLGLMDRSRIIGLFETVMAGDAKGAIGEIEAQHRDGGDPATILGDLADYVHWVTRLKVVKEGALADSSRTEAEKTRGAGHAQTCGIAHLTRAWSMLLKGIREAELHSDPLMAAEMVLIRLCHAADLPGGEELAKIVKQPQSSERVAPVSARELLRDTSGAPVESRGALAVKPQVPAPTETRAFTSFGDLVALATEKRDIKLKTDLETLIRPIRVAPGQFELALEPGAHAGLANEIGRKLEAFTGMRWIVMVAKDGGDKPVSRQRQEARDNLFFTAREHPDVQAVLKRFPGAEIIDVKLPDDSPPPPGMSESDEEPR
ncbi:DNA polymerase III subunit gamma/tau [Aestuariivirga sp.]|uniref:DNA polymerase III subunit gamma/tau n=1 Tax=Aestuariivirga sp. TaxID=2650926 RepID=UPI0025B909AC|nr:DNA polymerase III subunit gamma/tau [Aestuariivirga sp.]MCA3555606.1 DNA polymerase III subunit gamma/tau [Aestuariivirga sp.]